MSKRTIELGTRAYIALLTICFTLIILSACSLAVYTIYQVTKKEQVSIESTTQIPEEYEGIYNVSAILSPDTLRKRGVPEYVIKLKEKKCKDYIQRYRIIAQREEQLYGIPAKIKLAQALLESDAGESRLAKENNNHFGIKCFSKNCIKGHCSNYSDDSHKDFFREFNSVVDSYRAHSFLLIGRRYKHLLKLSMDDLLEWANGIQQAGYSTDINYGDKIIKINKWLVADSPFNVFRD